MPLMKSLILVVFNARWGTSPQLNRNYELRIINYELPRLRLDWPEAEF